VSLWATVRHRGGLLVLLAAALLLLSPAAGVLPVQALEDTVFSVSDCPVLSQGFTPTGNCRTEWTFGTYKVHWLYCFYENPAVSGKARGHLALFEATEEAVSGVFTAGTKDECSTITPGWMGGWSRILDDSDDGFVMLCGRPGENPEGPDFHEIQGNIRYKNCVIDAHVEAYGTEDLVKVVFNELVEKFEALADQKGASAGEAEEPAEQPEEEQQEQEEEVERVHGGQVVYTRGCVQIRRDGSDTWERVEQSMQLYGGDEIRTRERACAEVVLRGQHIVRMEDRSWLRVPRAWKSDEREPTVMDVLGCIWCQVRRLATGENFRTNTPACVVGVKGTEFVVRHDPDQVTDSIMVRQGTVEVSGNEGGTATVNAGQQVQVLNGVAGAPVPLSEVAWDEVRRSFTARGLTFESRGRPTGGTVRIPLTLRGIEEELGNMDLALGYDPTVLQPTAVEPGSVAADSLFDYGIADGTIRIALAHAEGFGGDGAVAYVLCNVIGAQGWASPLSVTELIANHADDYSLVEIPTEDGLFQVTGTEESRGDADGDYLLTPFDALMALKMEQGSLAMDPVLDIDGDGQVTAEDARLILSWAVNPA
jgi:hypothetical protein